MKKEEHLSILVFIFFVFLTFLTFKIYSQNTQNTDTILHDTITYVSVQNLRPVLLKKGGIQFSLGIDFPRFYKSYNSKTKRMEKINPHFIFNETYFNGYFTYGLTDKVNIYGILPVVNIHHYTPMKIQEGVGFGDIKIGMDYQIVGIKDSSDDVLSAELRVTLPTGRHDNLAPTDYFTGNGSFGFMLLLNGLHKFDKNNLWYSVYYDYRTNHHGIQAGDETGIFLTMQHPYYTKFGNFGLEYGTYFYYNFYDKISGNISPMTRDYSANLYLGAWYKYLDKYYIRFGVPYSVYQNGAILTKYQVMVQFDYLIK